MKLSRVDLNLLVAFDAILQTRSVTRAAARTGLSKPAMSHALARLRGEVGDPILVRAGQSWMLTDGAAAMTERVHQLVAEAGQLLAPLRSFSPRALARDFRIHATDHVLSVMGVALCRAVAAEAPRVVLRFLTIPHDDVAALRDEGSDLALGVFPRLTAEFRTQALFRDRFVCVVRKGHPRVKGRLDLKTLATLHHVQIAPRGQPGGPLDEALAKKGMKRQVVRTVPYFLVALELVAQTDCVVTVSERLARAHAERLGLQILKPPVPLASYTLSQVWHPRVEPDPGHAWLRRTVAHVAERLESEQADEPR